MGVLPGSGTGPSPSRSRGSGSGNANHAPLGRERSLGGFRGGDRGDPGDGGDGAGPEDFDGKRPRKSVMRKTVDYNSSFVGLVEQRVWQRGAMGSGSSGDGLGDLRRDRRALQPDVLYYPELLPPSGCRDNPANAITTRFVKTATNKVRCPVFTLAWTPEGRRLITGASSGEFTLWNGLTFNFETILQAHDSAVRTMRWSHNESWMVTGDHGGYVKYWQSNMNNVKMFQAHKDPIRDIAFSPTDAKFASCSDDGTVRIWDFFSCSEEKVLRGHGSDVKCVDWHPSKGIIASGSRDNQQPIKLWDPRSGSSLATLHAHKSTVMDLRWNTNNGNWLLTASRDHLIKLFDIRHIKAGIGAQASSSSAVSSGSGGGAGELQTFRGHKKEASALAWHPVHEGIFSSGGSDGAVLFWSVGSEKEIGAIESAHDSIVWALAWHPIGHILCTGSNDHTCKYWTRNRPGDLMRDKYNNTQQHLNQHSHHEQQQQLDTSGSAATGSQSFDGDRLLAGASFAIPGMAPEDRVEIERGSRFGGSRGSRPDRSSQGGSNSDRHSRGQGIPGLDHSSLGSSSSSRDSSHHSGRDHRGDNSKSRSSYQMQQLQEQQQQQQKAKTPYTKPIPKSFQASWNHDAQPVQFGNVSEDQPAAGGQQDDCISLQELQRQATAVVAFGNVYPLLPGSNLYLSILSGEMAVKDILRCEFLT